MPRGSLILPFFCLVACGDGGASDSAEPTSGDSGETDNAAPCVLLADGTYQASGSCFGMTMTVGLDMDDAACSFVLGDWSMNHGNSPEGGTVDEDQVSLAGGDFDGCTGTIDGATVSGVCDDGCAWELSLE